MLEYTWEKQMGDDMDKDSKQDTRLQKTSCAFSSPWTAKDSTSMLFQLEIRAALWFNECFFQHQLWVWLLCMEKSYRWAIRATSKVSTYRSTFAWSTSCSLDLADGLEGKKNPKQPKPKSIIINVLLWATKWYCFLITSQTRESSTEGLVL